MGTRGRPIVWTEERALDAIAEFVVRENRLPVRADWGGGEMPGRETVAKLFGSERRAIVAAFVRAAKS